MKIAFWSVAEHHQVALLPIYKEMKKKGFNVADLSLKPFKATEAYDGVVTSTAPDVPPSERRRCIYAFHSLAVWHRHPKCEDYPLIPKFKGVMFPGLWWLQPYRNEHRLPQHYAVVGWPKSDMLFKPNLECVERYKWNLNLSLPCDKTVLYASSMSDYQRMKTVQLLIQLSRKMRFNLIVKIHQGTNLWYPQTINPVRAALKGLNLIESIKDITPLFPLSDVIISESSGTLWEFMITGKPSIQMEHTPPAKKYPGGVLTANFTSLEEKIKVCLRNPDILKKDRDLWLRKAVNTPDGTATEKAISFIKEVFSR